MVTRVSAIITKSNHTQERIHGSHSIAGQPFLAITPQQKAKTIPFLSLLRKSKPGQ
jgi:hypothetical protein